MADVLCRRGVRALVVRGDDGLDEISTITTTHVWDATGDTVVETSIDPTMLGIALVRPEALRGGEPARNALLLRKVLGGVGASDPDAEHVAAIRDAVALNAAAALVAFDAASGRGGDEPLIDRIAERLPTAREVLESRSALALLDRWIAVTQDLRG